MSEPRTVHFVGSYPAPDPERAMREMLSVLDHGVRPLAIPDGETDRPSWVRDESETFEKHPAIATVKPGDYSGWDALPTYRIADPDAFTVDSVEAYLRYADEARAARALLDRLQRDGLGDGVPLQHGIPSPFDLYLALDTAGALARQDLAPLPVVRDAIARHVTRIHDEVDPEAIIQFETPVGLAFTAMADRMPPAFGPAAAARAITDAVADTPQGTNFGVHVCVGDLNNEARLSDAGGRHSTRLATLVLGAWPGGRHLRYLHVPLAAGKEPPSLEPADYAPLASLGEALHPDVTLVAGLAHEKQSLDEQLRVRDIVERTVGRRVAIAAACGLGRRSPEVARRVVTRMAELAR